MTEALRTTIPPDGGFRAAGWQFYRGVPSYIWDGESLPVPIEEIADSHLGLLVREVEDLAVAAGLPELQPGQVLSGLLLPNRGEIWVSAPEAREWPPRRRFTIAHEIGHWCLHRDHSNPVYRRSTSVVEEDPPDVHDDPAPVPTAEEEANAFAAAVLMPAPLLLAQYETCGHDFRILCERFASSGAAMGRRLHTVIPRGQGG